MKSRIFTAVGIAVAMLVPAGGILAIGASTAGATTAHVHMMVNATFINGTTVSHIACPTPTYGTLTLAGASTLKNTNMYQGLCASSGSGQGIGTTTTITFLITPTGLLLMPASTPQGTLWAGTFSVKLVLLGSHCTITFGNNITLFKTPTDPRQLVSNVTSTAGATVSGGGFCFLITGPLSTGTFKIDLLLSSTSTPWLTL